MKVEAFIIHLKRATARAPQVERLKKSLPLPVTVIDAVDGQALTSDEIAAVYRPDLYRPYYPFALRASEVACFLSHRKAWQEIVDRDLDAGLVVEDDVELDAEHFGPLLDLACETTGPGDFVRFPMKKRERGRLLAGPHTQRLFEPRHVALGMQAQLVGRDAAATLLGTTELFDRPVDTMIQMRWVHHTRILSTRPVAVRQIAAQLGGTTVQGGTKSAGEIFTREVLRVHYRVAMGVRNMLE